MAALTKKVDIQVKDGVLFSHKVKGATKIHQGALVVIGADGYLKPAVDEAGSFFAGIAFESCDNSAGADGAVYCRVQKRGNALLTGSGFAMADCGANALAADDGTVTKTSAAGRAVVGPIIDVVSSTQVWVELKANEAAATS